MDTIIPTNKRNIFEYGSGIEPQLLKKSEVCEMDTIMSTKELSTNVRKAFASAHTMRNVLLRNPSKPHKGA